MARKLTPYPTFQCVAEPGKDDLSEEGRAEVFCAALETALAARMEGIARVDRNDASLRVRVSSTPLGWSVSILDTNADVIEGPFEHEVMDAAPDKATLGNFPDFIAERLLGQG